MIISYLIERDQVINMDRSKKYKSLVKNTLIFALGNIGSKVIVFFLVPFYTYYLTPEEYGISDLVFTISQLSIPFFSVVIFDAVIRFALYRKERPQDALLVGIVVWIVGTLIAFLCTPLFGIYKVVDDWKWYISIYISVSMLVSIELNYLKAIDKNISYSLICIIQTLSLALLNIFLVAHLRLGIEGYLISYVGSSIIAAIIAIFAGGLVKELKKSHYDKSLAKQMIIYSSPLILNNLSWWVIQSSDKLMIESMVDSTALGIYNVASRIPSLITVFVAIFQQAWGISSIKEMDSSNDKVYYTNVFEFYSFISFVGGIAICAIIKPFMDIYVMSESYGDVWKYVPLLLAGAVFSSLAAYCGGMYGALKKSVNNMFTTLLAAIVNIIVNFIAILYLGVWGAIIGTLVAYIILAFVRIIDVKRYVNIGINWRKLLTNSFLILAQAIVMALTSYVVGAICSAIAISIFFIVNKREVIRFAQYIKHRRKNNV